MLLAVAQLVGIVVAPAAALAGALGGVALSNRQARRRDEAGRREARREGLREIALELIYAALSWNTSTLSYTTLGIAAVNSGRGYDEEPVMVAGRELGAARERMLRALSAFALTTSDPELVGAATALRTVVDSTVALTSPLLGPGLRGQRITDGAAFSALFDHVTSFPEHVTAFEQTVANHIAGPVRADTD